MKQSVFFERMIATPEGRFRACYSQHGLRALVFPSGAGPARSPTGVPPLPPRVRRWHAMTVKALGATLAGRQAGRLPPLDLSGGSEFQRRVWRALRRIRRGQTRSYAQIARLVGSPRAARAVGGACGANPIPVLIPCHRVVASGGGLGGFSADLKWKVALLEREVSFKEKRRPTAASGAPAGVAFASPTASRIRPQGRTSP